MKLPKPEIGKIYVDYDDEYIEIYRVSKAEYNIYRIDEVYWLTLFCSGDEKLEPTDEHSYGVGIEINLPFSDDPRTNLFDGAHLKGIAYDEQYGGWLTNMFYYSHNGFEDPDVHIESMKDSVLVMTVKGEVDYNPCIFRAEFVPNAERKRSVS